MKHDPDILSAAPVVSLVNGAIILAYVWKLQCYKKNHEAGTNNYVLAQGAYRNNRSQLGIYERRA